MKAYWGVEVQLRASLTLALDGGEWSVSHPGRFNPRIGGWEGPRTVLVAVVKRKISKVK
jgi:hypothetical protein